ncbi:MAG: hypothetical protein M0T74_07140 [Desulfitobacterium hafniense]|nr:hypothetical protein [Desulfitobacterium hafniense]
MSKTVSLARSIKPEYLDNIVNICLTTSEFEEIKAHINEYLSHHIESSINIRKTREILLNTWVNIPKELIEFRNNALEIYKSATNSERIAIHWAMLILAFPIFKDLCSIIGKLADVQETVTITQIKRRIFEQWGERSTLFHCINKNVKTLKDFGVLSQTKPGVYTTPKIKITDVRCTSLLVYSALKSNGKLYSNLSGLESFPELFPFLFDVKYEELQSVSIFKIDRIGGEIVVSV